jgi:Transmembrane protein of unknown function (DUF3556)
MGLMTGDFPPVEPTEFMQKPYRERTKVLARHWVEYGFGAPKITGFVYIAKLVLLYALGGLLVATLTSRLNPLDPGQWWPHTIVYQKLVLWTVLLETIGVAGSWGPLAGHFSPMTAGFRHYGRPGTIRLPPWPDALKITQGDERTTLDVALYVLLLASIATAIALPGTGAHDLVPHAAIITIIVLLVALGLRDKIVFLAARGEQYLPALIFFAFFPYVDMIVAAKLLIVIVWCGAAFSKFGRHFANVIPPMVSNTPWLFIKRIKHLHYRGFPEDLRPSERAVGLAHIGGTFVEFVTPLILLFSHNHVVTVGAVVLMLGFHAFIISTFPLAVPLEWNALFMYIAAFLFLGHPNQAGFGLENMDPGLLILTVGGLLLFPVLGNLRPDLVSFLPSMRQYSGNWATAIWAMAPGCEQKLNEGIVKAAKMQKDQLTDMYGEREAEVVMSQILAWRAMHSQGRGLNSVMMKTLGDDIDTYTLREAEFSCNALIGFNFGDGHLHDRRMIEAVQKRCRFAPGEFIVVWAESEPLGAGRQEYLVIDAAVGVVERGSWIVKEAIAEQPWLPNGPIRTLVKWAREDYERVRHGTERPAPVAAVPALHPEVIA